MLPGALHGPAPGEGSAPRRGPVLRVAVLSDVHGNVPALEAVLADAHAAGPDLFVFCGDLTWGPEPERTADLVGALGPRAVCVRGNADRFVREVAAGLRPPANARESWICERHSPAALRLVSGFAFTAVVDVHGLGPVRFCHGSPRSDHELVTARTPARRFAEFTAGIEERVLVTGHSHLQFDRRVAGLRSVNPGSVGLPFHAGTPGTAYWALLGPDVSLRRSLFDAADAAARSTAAGDPGARRYADLLLTPPSAREITAHAEGLVFSD